MRYSCILFFRCHKYFPNPNHVQSFCKNTSLPLNQLSKLGGLIPPHLLLCFLPGFRQDPGHLQIIARLWCLGIFNGFSTACLEEMAEIPAVRFFFYQTSRKTALFWHHKTCGLYYGLGDIYYFWENVFPLIARCFLETWPLSTTILPL